MNVDLVGGTYRLASAALPGGSRWSQPGPRAGGAYDGVLHGASAGEVRAAVASLAALQSATAGWDWLLTTQTAAGLASGASVRLPRDTLGAVRRFLRCVQPRSLVLLEGELWPTLLRECEATGVRVGVLGARVSPRAMAWYRLLPATTRRRLFASVDGFAAASADDAGRLTSLGVHPDRVAVTGWLKWPTEAACSEPQAQLGDLSVDPANASFSGPLGSTPLLILGSVHPGELTELAAALSGTPLAAGACRWMIVPRHPPKAKRLRAEASRVCTAGSWRVEERFGVLRAWYGHAQAAFVGGGARGRGVHDLLEPLSHGLRPLFFAARGDPAGVGATLQKHGLAVRLSSRAEGPQPSPGGRRVEALNPAPRALEGLRAAHDGRARGVRFLSERGVLS